MKANRKATAADVALAANVSPAAVSRAFRPGSPIAAATRNRILAVAAELGYSAPSAQALSALGSRTITLVAGDLENPFYPMVTNIFSQGIHARDRRMILHAVPPEGDVDLVMRQVLDFRSEAAIVTSSLMSSRLAQECRTKQMPVVLFNRVQPDMQMTAVTCDNYGGGRLVAQRFVERGHRRIALLGGRRDTSTHIERVRGFRDLLEEAGRKPAVALSGEYSYRVSLEAMRGLLKTRQRPEAIFCINDVMAFAALDAAREAGLSVPDDLAVIGFDDIPMADWSSYRLTTVRQPVERMVADALELVERLIEDPGNTGEIRIAPVSLVDRMTG